jgi:hypothetical protein
MDDQSENLSGYTQVRTKVNRKDWYWFVRLVFDHRELLRVTTARFGVAGCYK